MSAFTSTKISLPKKDEGDTEDQFLFNWKVELTEKLYLKESGNEAVGDCWEKAAAFINFVHAKAKEEGCSL